MTLAAERAARSRVVSTALLIRLDHHDGSVTRVTTSYRTLEWGGHEWRGAGAALAVDLPDMSGEIAVAEWSVSLSGLTEDFAWLADEPVRGQPATCWLAWLDASGRVLAADEVEAGKQDRVTWSESEDGRQALLLTCTGGFSFLANQTVARWTPEHQRAWLASIGEDPDSDSGFDSQHAVPDDAEATAWWPPA